MKKKYIIYVSKDKKLFDVKLDHDLDLIYNLKHFEFYGLYQYKKENEG